MDHEIKINARGLSSPGPRLMVEKALAEKRYKLMRVVVSGLEAAEDIRTAFSAKGAEVTVDQIGDDYHVFLLFES